MILSWSPVQSAEGDVTQTEIDRVIKNFADRSGYPGLAYAITRGDQVVRVGGHGHDSRGAAVTGDTRMPIASVSKQFTAVAVMQLVESGKVLLDSPLRRYLPEFVVDDPRGADITVRHLLTHTSGITDLTLREKSLPQPRSPAGAVDRARQASLAAPPGSEYHYTNTNYHLAARLVEVVRGEPFAAALSNNVFEPAGMRSTVSITSTPADLPPDVARGHGYVYGATPTATEPHRFVAGSDGVITTANDLARWLVVLRNGGRAADGTSIISSSALSTMQQPVRSDVAYGLGWQIGSDGQPEHGGFWFTYTATEKLLESGYGVAVIANSGYTVGNEGPGQLAEDLARVLGGESPPPPAPVRLILDLVLGGLTLIAAALGIRALVRTPAWERRFAAKPAWWKIAGFVPRMIPLITLVALPHLLGSMVGGGRDATFLQACYFAPALVILLLIMALLQGAILATRGRSLARLLRSRQHEVDREIRQDHDADQR
jgi:CubicO group peptidase (beta-lactamase class C family)